MKEAPRSAYDTVGGLVYFPRMLDKIRMHAEGHLPEDYHGNLGVGFDGRTVRFLGVDYTALRDRVLAGENDESVLQWCFENGRRPTEEAILIWNSFMRKRGWRDETDGGTGGLEKYKAESGLAHRKDLVTYFDFYEAEEGRRP